MAWEALVPRLSKRERLRRERIGRALRAYHKQKRALREVKAEAARRYWRRVKQAAGRHDLTIDQARQVIRVAGEQAIPVYQAVPRVKRPPVPPPVPPPPPPRPPFPPPPPPPEEIIPPEEPLAPRAVPGRVWSAAGPDDPTQAEVGWNLVPRIEQGFVQHPRDMLLGTGIMEGHFKVFVEGIYQRDSVVQFESARDRDAFISNYYAALRAVHQEFIDQGIESGRLTITLLSIRAV